MRMIVLAASLMLATPTFAAPVAFQAPVEPAATRATLVEAETAPGGRLIIDGATWRCEATACTASGGTNQTATRACRRVVARLGKVTDFAWKGQALTAEELAVCNR